MSIEVLPLGVACNLECSYCYQQPIREAGNQGHPKYDMEAMKKALLAEGFRFTVFGGEPLLVPTDDLRELFRWGLETFGAQADAHGSSYPNGIQTNGALMTDEHLRMFRKYRVGVGVSIDGPGELNDARWAGSAEKTREATARSLAAIDRLLEAGIVPSLIVTLTRANASGERLPRLLEWLTSLARRGVRHANLHLLEVDMPGVRERLALTEDENVAAMLACARLQASEPITFLPLTDMARLLRGEDRWGELPGGGHSAGTSCTWNGCDPYTTDAVRSVDGRGDRGNCGRTSKDGPYWAKAGAAGFERYLALMHAPMSYGGCSGCRFFYACKGHCPGEGEHGDWRGKTEHCGTLMRVFAALEAAMLAEGEEPLSLSPRRDGAVAALASAWASGRRMGVAEALQAAEARGEPQGGALGAAPPDAPHGDAPHGDHTDAERPVVTHGDHTDAALETTGGGGPWARL